MVEKKDKKKPSKKRVKKPVAKKQIDKKSITNSQNDNINQRQSVVVHLGKNTYRKRATVSKSTSKQASTPNVIVSPTISIPYYIPRVEQVYPENIKIQEPVAVKENTVAPVKENTVASVKEKKPKREVPTAVPIEEDVVSNDKPIFAGNAINAPRRGRPPNTDVQNAIAKERRNELARQRRAVEKQRMISEVIQMEGQDINVLEPVVAPEPTIIIPRRRRTKKIIIEED